MGFLKHKGLFLVMLVAFISGFALLHKGLPPTHDGEYHVVRFYELDKVLREGTLYPRWAPDLNNGYGVPLFNYVYPLPNYVASFFHFFGFSFIDSFKLNMFAATIIGSLFFYFWAKQYWGEHGGVVSSAFYAFSPYRLLDIYIRGSVGEVWALAFFPALLWSFKKSITTKREIYFLLNTLFLSLLIFSHNILGLFFFGFFVFYALFELKETKNRELLLKSIKGAILGLGISSIFWLPAILEKNLVTGLQVTNIKDNFPEIYQLVIPSWGSGFSAENLKDQMSFQIGLANLFVILFLTFGIIFLRKKIKYKKIIIFMILWFYLVLFLITPYSGWAWDNIPLIGYAQFPWRLLSFEIIIAPFLAGSILLLFKKGFKKNFVFLILIGAVFFLNINYAKPAFYHYREDSHYLTRSNFIDGTNSIGNQFNTIWLSGVPEKDKRKLKFTKGSGQISNIKQKSSRLEFEIWAKEDSVVRTHFAFFPGWEGRIDEKSLELNNKDGIVHLKIPKGKHSVIVELKDTRIRLLSSIVAVLSSIILTFAFVKYWYNKNAK